MLIAILTTAAAAAVLALVYEARAHRRTQRARTVEARAAERISRSLVAETQRADGFAAKLRTSEERRRRWQHVADSNGERVAVLLDALADSTPAGYHRWHRGRCVFCGAQRRSPSPGSRRWEYQARSGTEWTRTAPECDR